MNRKNKTERFSVDSLMTSVASTLVRDFQEVLKDPCFCSEFHDVLKSGNIARIRKASPTPTDDMDVATFKATYQIQSVLKRYRYQEDIYSDSELTELSIRGFLDTQDRLKRLDLDKTELKTRLILDLAKSYVTRILGTYSDEEHRSLCRFGKRASVGIPARKACLAERWELPITGSKDQVAWFDSEMSLDTAVQDYWISQKGSDPNRSTYQVTESLALTLVPKTFKSLRSIMPNTTIGSYMSYGLGEMMRKRLKKEGYDIRTLQQRHKFLACRESVNNLLTTADLSSASDSISVALVRRLVPDDWFEILNQSRIGHVMLPDGQSVESLTFCTMGVGYTFPLQTLIFLSLLKAVEAFHYGRFDRRTISVYGDDLIYSSRMHSEVVLFLNECGFLINVEKTFSDGHFRESCGGDYYHGVDVRPFQPRNGSAFVGSKSYEAILYKFVNTLLTRWTEYEIGRTLKHLINEIESLVNRVKLVPCDFPDDAGVKVSSLKLKGFLEFANVACPKHVGHNVYRFSYLRFTPDRREEVRHGPYLWDRLRGTAVSDCNYSDHKLFQELPGPLASFINEVVGIQEVTSELITAEVKPTSYVRSCLTGRRQRRLSTFVTVSHTGRYTRQYGTSCFEVRR